MPRVLPFDPARYAKTTAPVVDAFAHDTGEVKTEFTRAFLSRICQRMNDRFDKTGDLSPIVVGHTIDGAPEHDQPQKVGYLHNWQMGELDGRPAVYADHYIQNQNTVVVQGVPLKLSAREVVERWPRRSGEIWLGKYEIDPHCLLGATTPCRDLGILRLSASGEGAVTYQSPGELTMPTELSAAAPQDTGPFKNLEAQLAQLTAMVGQLLEAVQNGGPAGAAGKPGEPAGGDQASFEDFLKQLDAEGGEEPEEKPEPKEPKKEKEDEEKVKLQRERDEAVVKLARQTLIGELTKLKDEHHVAVDPTSEDTIRDLLSLPADLQGKMLKLMRDSAPKLPGAGGHLNSIVADASAPAGTKRIDSPEKRDEVIKLAKKENLLYTQAAVKLGYTLDTK